MFAKHSMLSALYNVVQATDIFLFLFFFLPSCCRTLECTARNERMCTRCTLQLQRRRMSERARDNRRETLSIREYISPNLDIVIFQSTLDRPSEIVKGALSYALQKFTRNTKLTNFGGFSTVTKYPRLFFVIVRGKKTNEIVLSNIRDRHGSPFRFRFILTWSLWTSRERKSWRDIFDKTFRELRSVSAVTYCNANDINDVLLNPIDYFRSV